jgi:hypothetical protein
MNVQDHLHGILGSKWSFYRRGHGTFKDVYVKQFIHTTDPYNGVIDVDIRQYPDVQHGDMDFDLLIPFLIKNIQIGGSLCRIEIRYTYDHRHCGYWLYYRFKPHEFRMIQLLAEPPVPKDILRHIYTFIRK